MLLLLSGGGKKGCRDRLAPADYAVTATIPGMNLEDARFRVRALRDQLKDITVRDPEQEVRGLALPVIDSILTEARKNIMPSDPVIDAITGLITPQRLWRANPSELSMPSWSLTNSWKP